VVVSHAGSGSLIGALAHGLPSLLIPMGADQPLNAARCQALGAAHVLDAVTLTSASAREAVSPSWPTQSIDAPPNACTTKS
jgi:UDP:flavonoid glycosyltransferase YjiC (YdhE family)